MGSKFIVPLRLLELNVTPALPSTDWHKLYYKNGYLKTLKASEKDVVLDRPLDGFVAGPCLPITSTDTVLDAFQKLQCQVSLLASTPPQIEVVEAGLNIDVVLAVIGNTYTYTVGTISNPQFDEVSFSSDGTKLNSMSGLVVGPNVTETIDVNGFVTYTIGSSDINYAKVAFVDVTNGDNSTAVLGVFTKPFATINAATAAASSAGFSDTQRGLIYIRQGQYSTGSANMSYQFIDYYCEPGVVFTGGTMWLFVSNANLYGHATFVGNSTIRANTALNNHLEFHKAEVTSIFMLMDSNCSGNLHVRCRSTKTGVSPVTQFGYTLRGSANYTFHISEFIEGANQIFGIRYASGNIVINCPRIIIDDVNAASNNYKGAFAFYENYGVKVTFNGDIYSNETFYRGGTSGVVLFWAGALANFTINGNIYGGFSMGLYLGSSNSSSILTLNGSITSRTRCSYVAAGTLVIKDGFVLGPVELTVPLIGITNSSQAFFINTAFKQLNSDIDCIRTENANVRLNVHNCTGQISGLAGEFISSTVPINVRLHNVRANKPLNANVTDVLSPTGFISDPEIIVHTFN